ncbi:ATP-binding protein [Neptunomonas japonica]|uniref:Sensor protein n=1 Tax=Neptunomonas japonica JAMM 1380 TaxID=1441457 RepID=A0A7R6PIG5_9GAMM|nr:ATP-binding protein [Neptunomonas japonica]BBB30802.1 two-component system, NarL family, nitrate/nitrite sensor histidine kinase NarX [Neptunomonas japonica JAMM 1380]
MHFFKQSIIARLGAAMLAISIMAVVSMIGSVIVAESTQGDAAGINLAGSLRMLSYRVIAETGQYTQSPSEENHSKVKLSISEFEKRINSPILKTVIPQDGDHDLYRLHNNLVNDWNEHIIPSLNKALIDTQPSHKYIDLIEKFVHRIDQMVLLLERSTESKIKLLSLVQAISLFMTVLIIFIAMLDIKNNVVLPLQELVHMARRASRGDLAARVEYESQDELGVLGDSFNHMAEELSKIYTDLEQRVERKTALLQQSNESLQLLYDTTRCFNRKEDICRRLMPVMQQLETVSPFGPIEVTLCEPNNKKSYRELTTQTIERPENCRVLSCNSCIVQELDHRPHKTLSLPIQTRETYFGEFNAQFLPHVPPNQSEIKLIETIVENLATSMSLELKAEQEQQLSLIEERAVIARELHDSLAQSLSYLKIQVTRLQILRKKESSTESIDDVVDELKEGLNNAYRQLRELLTTFRLKLDEPGLAHALETTINEFSERLGIPIKYHYGIHHLTLTPNEEIHVLQLLREALANVVKHSQASKVSVSISAEKDEITVSIQDNGVGLPQNQELTNHYGLVIMQDRAATINGQLSIANQPSGGTRVLLTFKSKHH